MVRTDYFNGLFDDLPPAPVTHVTQRQTDCVTTSVRSATHKNSDLADPLRTLRTLRTKTGNTEAEARRALKAYRYRLREYPNDLILIAPGTSLDEATEGLRRRFGKRLIDVRAYKRQPLADDSDGEPKR